MFMMPVFDTASYSAGGGSDPDLTTNLIAYWELSDETDAHTNSYDMTENNSPSYTTGLIGDAFNGDGSAYLSHADNADLGYSGDFSASIWTKGNDTAGLMGKGQAIFQGSEWNLQQSFSGGFVIKADIFSRNVQSSPINTAVWTHVVMTFDESTGELELFIDGVSEGTATHASTPSRKTAAPFVIGAHSENAGLYDADLDQAGFWKEVLTQEKIDWLYNSGSGRSYSDVSASGS